MTPIQDSPEMLQWTDPKALLAWLQKTDLDTRPRTELVKLFRAVDARMDKAVTGPGMADYAWSTPWHVLDDILDPCGLMTWPNPDWSLLTLGDNPNQMEMFG